MKQPGKSGAASAAGDADATTVVVDVEAMAYGPHAIARHDGLVLFVRGAAPGERVEARIRERRRNHAFADVVRVVHGSGARVQPPCPIVERCGGCPWQHLSYETQLAAKRRIVADHLSRIGGLSVDVPPVLPSPRVFGYRRRLKLRIDGGQIGFYAGGTHDLVPVDDCALAETEINAGLPAARRLVGRLSSRLRRLEIVASHQTDAAGGLVMAGEVEGKWVASDESECRSWLDETACCDGLSLRGRGWQRSWGALDVVMRPQPHLLLGAAASGFSQVNPAANQLLVDVVLRMAGEGFDGLAGRSVFEAYAGAGNFSAPLADRGALVTAVEQWPDSCGSARRNAENLGLPWQIEQGRVERIAQRLAAAGARFDMVLLDPPRNGAAPLLPAIMALAPAQVIYVSCDPATLARDLAGISTRYHVAEVQPIDMFPHTYHVETVVRCSLREPLGGGVPSQGADSL